MNNFGQIVAAVGIRVGDTSTSFATTIKGYVNQRYKEIWERFNWGTIKPSYSFNTVANIQDYLLESGFWKPLYCYDSTNGIDITEISLQDMERKYAGNLSDTGNPREYAIYDKLNAATPTPTGALEQYVRFYPIPSAVISISMPYMLDAGDMSADTDLPVIDCDYEVELGATADAWRTKRQFAKAADFDQQFEQHIQHMIWRRCNSPNQMVQFIPRTFPKDMLY
jgi:hypothetical protein